jgi:predicted DNA-binding protein YlxM (UPF0122 family)
MSIQKFNKSQSKLIKSKSPYMGASKNYHKPAVIEIANNLMKTETRQVAFSKAQKIYDRQRGKVQKKVVFSQYDKATNKNNKTALVLTPNQKCLVDKLVTRQLKHAYKTENKILSKESIIDQIMNEFKMLFDTQNKLGLVKSLTIKLKDQGFTHRQAYSIALKASKN